MTGLYSPINKLMEQVTRPKGTGAEYMAELQKKPGYKPAEAEDRDLQTLMALPQMERAAFMEKLKAQKNKFPLKQRVLEGKQTHHESYTLPGGENYREMLLHTPMPEGKGFEGVPQHFGGAPNVIASIMAKDRTSPEGKKILHLEEIQSDWHQAGRKSGYQPADLDKQIAEVAAWRKRLAHNGRMGGYHLDPEDRFEHDKAVEEAEAEHDKLQDLKEMGVPHGPHAKDWHELALKAMIQHAAENGYDQIAINHGKTVADRHGLSKVVKHIDATRYALPSLGPVADVNIAGLNGAQLHAEYGATEKELAKLLGKELAKKIISQPEESPQRHEGEDLDIGGEGMKGFYDKMVPTFLNKFGKKHGVQVQQGAIATGEESMIPDNAGLGMIRSGQPKMAPVHTFDITPGMREDVLKNGIPRYAEGGDVNDADRMTPRSRGRTSFGAAPRGNQIIKETGGNWIGGSIEEALKPLMSQGPTEADRAWLEQHALQNPQAARQGIEAIPRTQAINNWIDRNLANYVKKQMATKEDPVRKLAEQGITHLPQDAINRGQWESDHLGKIRRSEGFPESGLATNEASRGWENLADEAIQITAPIVANKEMMEANPWLAKLPPNQSVYRARKADISELGFDHIVDVLKQDVAAGRIRPEQLNKISMEQAVRRAYEFDQEQAKKMRETAVKATEGMPVVKQYDTGHKWIELTTPKNMKLPEGYSVKPDPIRNQKTGAVDNNSYRLVNNEGKLVGWGQTEDEAVSAGLGKKVLKDALEYEGDTMGHCVGGYTPDVLEGKSRIYSLRDAKGEPHVTIETQPLRGAELGRHAADLPDGEDVVVMKNPPHRIVQIKGKQNRAPDKKYLPMVQDFVKSGKWSNVGDAKNAGLRKYGDVFNVNEQRNIEKTGEHVPEHEWLTGEDIQRLHNAITPPGKRLKYDANGNIIGNESGYAEGGGVSRETAKRGVAHFSRGGSDVSPAVNLQMAREAAEREGQHEDPHTRSLQQGWEHGWYHGTTGDIHSFAPDYLGESTGAPSAKQGYFFARDPSTPPEHMMRHNPDSVNFLIKAGKQVPPNPTMAGNGPHTASSYAGTGGSREYKTAMRLAHAAEKKGDWDAHAKHMEDAENAEIKSMQYRQQLVASHGDARDNMYEQVKNAWYGAHNADKFKNMSQPAYKQYDDLYSELMPYGWHMKHSPEQFESVKQHIKQLGDNPQTKRAINAINHYLSVSHERKAADVESGANVIPAALRYSNPMYHDFEGKPYREQSYNDLIKEAKLKGHDALILKNTFDPGGSTSGSKMIDVGVMFHPKQIRSKFAAFHPDRVHEPDLLAAKGGVVKEKVTISPDMDVMQYELINRKAK